MSLNFEVTSIQLPTIAVATDRLHVRSDSDIWGLAATALRFTFNGHEIRTYTFAGPCGRGVFTFYARTIHPIGGTGTSSYIYCPVRYKPP